ncbi:MAG: Na/Pi cotransporter family protein [Bacteroidetes bacterium]|nr:Na/Pi cotransporter family protein [Bacteroidota bacterium]
MEILILILKLSAGIGLFLFAMYLLEESLKNLSGRNFKIFLQRISKNALGAVTGGAIVTSILQSSSMVSLMVLAFVGAGVFTMKNAFAIILGANLGTTIDSWLVATIGFKINIEVIAYPSIFIGGLLLILFGKRQSIKYISYFLFGFGLLFIGLSFMKTAMEGQVKNFDFTQYADLPLIAFLVIGFIITLLVQSSSVTMALTLTALHTSAIDFQIAAVIVLGSETGTTIKLMLSGIGGTASKKRVVLGNLLFNIALTGFAFVFLKPILHVITNIFKISNPLIALVTFSSLINLCSILVFLPLLNPFVRFLERFFKDTDATTAAYICNANISETQTSLHLFKLEAAYFLHNSMLINLEQLDIETSWLQSSQDINRINASKKFHVKTLEEKYEFLKLLQGELQLFYIALRSKLKEDDYQELNQFVSSVRSSMYAVKSLKDIKSNISNLVRSSKNIKFKLFIALKNQTESFYKTLNAIIEKHDKYSSNKLHTAYNEIQNQYHVTLDNFYNDAHHSTLAGIDTTTIILFNRELFTSNRAMILAIKDLLLDEKEAEQFEELTV